MFKAFGEKIEYEHCACPPEISSGLDGIAHLVPVHCVRTKKEILKRIREHIQSVKWSRKILDKRIKTLELLVNRYKK
jgi:hypothetical protein